jgi:hypothetical protein
MLISVAQDNIHLVKNVFGSTASRKALGLVRFVPELGSESHDMMTIFPSLRSASYATPVANARSVVALVGSRLTGCK